MVKLNLRSPAVIAGVSFLLIWYGVMHQRVKSREHMTGAVRLKEADKKVVTDYLIASVINPAEAKSMKISPEAQTFINFLDQNPITAIDDKFMTNLTEILKSLSNNDFFLRKMLENPDTVKQGSRAAGGLVVANIIWSYADSYEKLKEAPTQSEFKEQMNTLLSNDPVYRPILMGLKLNLAREGEVIQTIERSKKIINEEPTQIGNVPNPNLKWPRQQLAFAENDMKAITLQKAALGENSYPLSGSSSPLVNQIFDITYKYYFGETISASNLAGGAWKAIIGIFGSIGAILVIAGVVYFVFLR